MPDEARREQGASLWRPTLQFSGTAGVGTNETSTTGARFSAPGFGTVDGASFDTSVTGGTLWRWSLQARQPLINRERDASKRQLELSADVADLEWRATQQTLMLRIAERYFDAALASRGLARAAAPAAGGRARAGRGARPLQARRRAGHRHPRGRSPGRRRARRGAGGGIGSCS